MDEGEFTNIFCLYFYKPLVKLSQQATKEIQDVVLEGKIRPLNTYLCNFIQVVGMTSISNLEGFLNAVGTYIFHW